MSASFQFYAWDGAEFRQGMAKAHAHAFRNGLFVGAVEGGNGHVCVELIAAPRPRSCSGTRGRGRKKAKQLRAKCRNVLTLGPKRRAFGDWPTECLLSLPRFARRRGPKGDRLRVLRESVSWLKGRT